MICLYIAGTRGLGWVRGAALRAEEIPVCDPSSLAHSLGLRAQCREAGRPQSRCLRRRLVQRQEQQEQGRCQGTEAGVPSSGRTS